MKLDTATHQAIVANISLGMGRQAAAAAAGVPAGVFERWQEQASKSRTGKAVSLVRAISQAEAERMRANLADRSRLSRADFLAMQLRDVTRACAAAEQAGSWQALATLRRQQADLHDKLDLERKSGNPELEEMSEEQYRVVLREMLEDWPEDYFDLAFKVYEERHRVTVFKSHTGGKTP